MGSKRRYPIKDHPEYRVYNDRFDKNRIDSQVLNAGRQDIPNVGTIFWTKENTKTWLGMLRGEKEELHKGFYFDWAGNARYEPAQMRLLEEKLEGFNRLWENYQQQRVNDGFPRPTDPPPHLKEEMLKVEADIDVMTEEIEELERNLAKWEASAQKEDDSMVLRYGLKQHWRRHGLGAKDPQLINVMSEIDGQRVTLTDDLLIIDDERSPYHGMLVADYRRLAKEWTQQRHQQDLQYLQDVLIPQARERGLPVPNDYVRMGRTVARAGLPKWPSWAENHKDKLRKPEQSEDRNIPVSKTKNI